ncbi:hypothetical protein IC575_019699 [Cucumis melo]
MGFKNPACNLTISLKTPINFSSTAAPSNSITLKHLATASIVLTHPPCGSFLRINSESNMLPPSTLSSMSKQTLLANLDRNSSLDRTISFACFHVPSNAIRTRSSVMLRSEMLIGGEE